MYNRDLSRAISSVLILIFAASFVVPFWVRGVKGWLLYAAIIIIGLMFRSAALRANIRHIEKTYPKHSELASVATKTTETKDRFTVTYYFVSFELANGIRKEFEVDRTIYSTLVEGDQGTLTFREKDDTRYFVDFTRN